MSEKYKETYSSEQKLVKDFLYDVRRKLPFWLKDQKEDVDEIIEELENHIWDRATELADGYDPSPDQVEQIINQMGSPSKIASEYKRRGKPKYFITEELWPQYQRSMMIFGAALVALNVIIAFARIGSHTAADIFGGLFQGMFTSLAIAVIITTVIFAALSHEGYLPDDLEGKVPFFIINLRGLRSSSDESRVAQAETAAAKTVVEDKPVRIIKEQPFPSTEKTTVIRERPTTIIREKVVVEPRTIYVDRPRSRSQRKSKHYLGRDYLGEGISGIIFGTIIMILPFMPFLDFLAMPMTLKYWFLIFGGAGVALGLIRFFQAIIGRMVHFQQFLMFIGMIPRAANIPLFLAIKNRPEILLTWLQNKLIGHITPEHVQLAVVIIAWVVVATTILSLIAELSRIIKLGVNGFPED